MRGLPNIGSTICYLNSILQIIFNDPELSYALKTRLPAEADEVALKFNTLLRNYHSNCDHRILQQSLYNFNQLFSQHYDIFSSGHNDQHEYLISLLTLLHDNYAVKSRFEITGRATTVSDKLESAAIESMRLEALTARFINITDQKDVAYTSPISDMFLGQIHHRTECVLCGHISHKFEVYKQLTVYIVPSESGKVSLEDCLYQYTGITEISDNKDDLYQCDSCKEYNRSRRRLTLWRLPKVLCICVRRHIFHKGQTYKDNRHVEAPFELDVSPYVSIPLSNTKYSLRSVANHEGAPHFGHCYSLIRTRQGWAKVDDENISPMDDTKVISPANYMYFYKLQE